VALVRFWPTSPEDNQARPAKRESRKSRRKLRVTSPPFEVARH